MITPTIKLIIELLALLVSSIVLYAQVKVHEDSVKTESFALRNEYAGKVTRAGFTPRLKVSQIVLDNPVSFGNSGKSLNILHTFDLNTLPQDAMPYFNGFAQHQGQGLTDEKFFELIVSNGSLCMN